jgi:hypothetical protein
MIGFMPATLDAAWYVAEHMREVDVQELRDLSGVGPFQAVVEAMKLPGEKWAGYYTDRPAALFGCAEVSILGCVGSPWLLGTDDVEHAPVSLVRVGRDLVHHWSQQFALLENRVDGRNVKTIRWLRALGFNFDEPVQIKPGVQSIRFWKGETHV